MTQPARDGRQRRFAAFGLAACALIWGLGRGAPVVARAYASERSTAAAVAQRVSEVRHTLAASRVIADSLRARQQIYHTNEQRLFVGATRNGLAADATTYISRLARSARLEVTTLEVQSDTAATAGLSCVALTLSAKADIYGLMQLLTSLEGSDKLFRIASLSVTQPNINGGPDAPEALNVQLTIQALTLLQDVR